MRWIFKTHLADAASLTEGANGTHVALVARAKRRGMKGGGRIQRDTWVGPQISGLQVVTLAEQGQEQVGVGRHKISQFKNCLLNCCWQKDTMYRQNPDKTKKINLRTVLNVNYVNIRFSFKSPIVQELHVNECRFRTMTDYYICELCRRNHRVFFVCIQPQKRSESHSDDGE